MRGEHPGHRQADLASGRHTGFAQLKGDVARDRGSRERALGRAPGGFPAAKAMDPIAATRLPGVELPTLMEEAARARSSTGAASSLPRRAGGRPRRAREGREWRSVMAERQGNRPPPAAGLAAFLRADLGHQAARPDRVRLVDPEGGAGCPGAEIAAPGSPQVSDAPALMGAGLPARPCRLRQGSKGGAAGGPARGPDRLMPRRCPRPLINRRRGQAS